MTNTDIDTVYPTDEQEKIIESNIEKRLFINAGPGTGKTFTLIQRVRFLIESNNIDPSEEILILSFSNSAIDEIKGRLKDFSYAEYDKSINIRTFDSYGSYLVYKLLGVDYTFKSITYNERIIDIIDLFKNQKDDNGNFVFQDEIKKYKHIFIDEMQDITNERALLTINILNFADEKCGFTLLGDSVQAIYDFFNKDESAETAIKISSRDLLDELLNIYDLSEIRLYKNHRIENENNNFLTDIALKIRELYFKDDKEAKNKLQDILYNCNRLELIDFETLKKKSDNKKIILVRWNKELLELASYLKKEKMSFEINDANKEIDKWFAFFLTKSEFVRFRKEKFNSIFNEIFPDSNRCLVDKAFEQLIFTQYYTNDERTKNKEIDLDQVIYNIKVSETINNIKIKELSFKEKNNLVLSTIHRFKGKENDEIILAINDDVNILAKKEDNLSDDEFFVYFVGLTRAKKKNYRLNIKKSKKISYEMINGKDRLCNFDFKNPLKIQILKEDIDYTSFVSNLIFDDNHIKESQCHIFNKLNEYDECRIIFKDTGSFIQIQYSKKWIDIALLKESFKEGILRKINNNKIKKIENIWIRNIRSYLFNGECENISKDFQKYQAWLVFDIQGIGDIII